MFSFSLDLGNKVLFHDTEFKTNFNYNCKPNNERKATKNGLTGEWGGDDSLLLLHMQKYKFVDFL